MVIDLRKILKRIIIIALIITLLITASITAVRFLYPVRYLDLVRQFAEEHSLEPALIMAIINAESRFRANAESHAGAKGLMQIMDTTAAWITEQANLNGYDARVFEPHANIAMGTWYIAHLLRTFENKQTALAAYNAGTGRVRNWLNNPNHSNDGTTLTNIPFTETANYVRRVTRNKRVYEFLLTWFHR